MIHITKNVYQEIAEQLSEEIGGRDYYSGRIERTTPDYDITLTSTLVVYHTTHTAPDGSFTTINDIVPIWWSCSTTTDEGERLNDFDFNRIKALVCE